MRKDIVDGLGRVLPLNAASYLTGKAAQISLPKPLNTMLCGAFAKTFGIDLSEAERPLNEYSSIEDLFTRKLKPGSRPIEGEPCCPADGILSIAAPVDNDAAIQAKGLTYSLKELMFGSFPPGDTRFGFYATIYLAPHNYHRVHSPIGGALSTIRYFPGELWPVNVPSVRFTPRLFTRNERMIFEIATAQGTLYLAMVGALNVGKMTTPFLPGFATNMQKTERVQEPQTFHLDVTHRIVAGQELGTFMLGSTVIIAFDDSLAKRYRMLQAWSSRPVRMGEKLGNRS